VGLDIRAVLTHWPRCVSLLASVCSWYQVLLMGDIGKYSVKIAAIPAKTWNYNRKRS
jgi:hypothetical protein